MTARGRTSSSHRGSDRHGRQWTVYALAAPPLPPTIQVGARTIRVLRVGPIGVLGRAPAAETTYTEAALRDQHEVVLALAEKFDPLLPVRFGTRMSQYDLRHTILRSVDVLSEALDNVRGRRQMTVRLIGASGAAAVATPGRSGVAYLQQRRAAYTIPVELEPVRAAVHQFISEERVAPGRAGVRVTLFHLIECDHIAAYIEAVEHTSRTMSPGSVAVTGPWPPFAFAPELRA